MLGETLDFEALFAAVPGAHLALTPDFTIVAATEDRLRVTMTTREGTIGRHLFEAFPDNPDDPAADGVRNLTASLNRVLATRRADRMPIQRYDIRRPPSEGGGFEERFWSPLNTPVLAQDGSVRYIIHSVDDVTELMRLRQSNTQLEEEVAELELRDAAHAASLRAVEEKFRRLAENAPDIVFHYRLLPAPGYEYISPAVTQLFGYTPDEFYADPEFARKIVHPDDADAIDRIRRGEATDLFKSRWTRKNGGEVWTETHITYIRDAAGEIVAYEGIARDVTERERAHEVRRELEERALRERLEILDRVTDGFFAVDRDWRITFVNRQFLQATGASSAIGMSFWEAFPEAADGVFYDQYHEALETGNSVHFEAPFEPLDAWYEVHAYPSQDGLSVYFRDVTEQRDAEEQLRQSQKMEAIGKLAGGVAHDFNNLLTVITGCTDIALATAGDDSVRENLDQIRSASSRAASLTQQLLAFSRRQILQPRVLDPNAHVRDTVTLLNRLIPADVEIRTSLAPDLARVRADAAQIDQILVNLAVNARDAMPDGGVLRIETRNVALDAETGRRKFLTPVEPGEYVLLSVSDSGCGMNEETRSRAFDPFFTTKPTNAGTGLGLSTVYGIVKQSDGHISIESELGSGTTVEIFLPATRKPLDRAEEPAGDGGEGTETILLVEDDDAVRHVVTKMLESRGYTILAAANCDDALAHARTAVRPPALILSDLVMPGGDGCLTVKRIRELHPNVKVLLMSGYTDDVVLRTRGFDPSLAFIQKPFTVDAFSRRVREVLEHGGPEPHTQQHREPAPNREHTHLVSAADQAAALRAH